ncbi:diacylglycerol kinase family enzyme [Labedella gwakjiensis]|uniref:Diacylglycerol kinase n=1 Tax=Labedella gwakjiensis TaxID=390269 RepID=A0A2P8GV44_9MICO|nr:diacylglycerol kinase family protein [Labedella gwakjiensis]PSL37831.1 diacylglycerol kinase family enzyme [Labedella gwakjiensis]RUQ87596.1 diacylglycerol kinase [Labedella gwakjiensis]
MAPDNHADEQHPTPESNPEAATHAEAEEQIEAQAHADADSDAHADADTDADADIENEAHAEITGPIDEADSDDADVTDQPAESEQRKLAAVIYNPVKVDLDALKATVEKEESDAGWETTLWFETSVEDPGGEVTKEALKAGATVIVAAGGDGTVRAVAESMWDSGARLALLPSGTGNLLARNLNLTLDDMQWALHVAFSGTDRPMDIALIDIERENGDIDKSAFLVMAGVGLDAKMLANTDDELKKKIGWLAYVKAIAQALRDKNQLRLRYSVDGNETRSLRAHTIIVGNTGTLAANVLLLPEAVIDDGYFEIVLLRPEGFIGWVQIFVKVIWENGVLRRSKVGRLMMSKDVDALNYVKGRKLVVRFRRPEEIELDGDDFGQAVAFNTRVRPGGLTVRVPADS